MSSPNCYEKRVGFEMVATGVIKSKKSDSKTHEVASDLLCLVREPVLVTQNGFLRDHHMNFWTPNFQ